MKHPSYTVTIGDDFHKYLFYSVGPKGRIAKGIIFSQIEENLFNLAFSAKTRLYQMQIMNNLQEINKSFDIQGYINNNWERFQENRPYQAFLVTKK
ncbi:MAG: hypothetical protein JST68_10930 [Bacteroidetes bacterium]|nr:hypothetical protein [Bacteroidota bacterium]